MIEAAYFDGCTARRQVVRLRPLRDGLELAGDGWLRREALIGVRVSEPQGAAPRTLRFGDGSYCEVAQGPALDEFLSQAGHREGLVVRLQGSWRLALAALAGVVATLAAAYFWGLPWLASVLAPRLPVPVVSALSQGVLNVLDGRALMPSRLPAARQARLQSEFAALAAGDPDLGHVQLLIRDARRMGPNAFALPDGRVVLFDQLVAVARDDDDVMAVLAHELGHVKYRHGVRQMIQSSAVAFVAAAYLGDISSVLAGMTTLLLDSRYSRRFETQADDYGAALLRREGRSPRRLAEMLERIERAQAALHHGERAGTELLSSHPATAERIRRLRGMD
jgi:Zn-dependent protease with chaperone function